MFMGKRGEHWEIWVQSREGVDSLATISVQAFTKHGEAIEQTAHHTGDPEGTETAD